MDGGEVVICQVPVVRYKSVEVVKRAIETEKPDAVITVGQATNGSSPSMELEQIVKGLLIAAQSIIDNQKDI